MVFGSARNSFHVKLKELSISPVIVNCHPADGGFISGSDVALCAAGSALLVRLVKISVIVIIVAIPAKFFFNLRPTVVSLYMKI